MFYVLYFVLLFMYSTLFQPRLFLKGFINKVELSFHSAWRCWDALYHRSYITLHLAICVSLFFCVSLWASGQGISNEEDFSWHIYSHWSVPHKWYHIACAFTSSLYSISLLSVIKPTVVVSSVNLIMVLELCRRGLSKQSYSVPVFRVSKEEVRSLTLTALGLTVRKLKINLQMAQGHKAWTQAFEE